jgi:sphingomyelin phosphodiesterase acid-like 3
LRTRGLRPLTSLIALLALADALLWSGALPSAVPRPSPGVTHGTTAREATTASFILAQATGTRARAPNATRPAAGAPNLGSFLMLADIHFDPFADPAIVPLLAAAPVDKWAAILQSSQASSSPSSLPGAKAARGLAPPASVAALGKGTRDSNYALLSAALAAARSSGTSYDYVLVAGDFLAHEFRSKYRAQKLADQDFLDFANKTMVFVSRTIQMAFPKVSVFGVVGNGDSACGDYAEPPHSALFARLATEWNVVASRPEAARDFAAGGYYAVPHPTVPNQELIVLNSTFWSSLYHAGCAAPADAPGEAPGDIEMAWLNQRLQEAQLAGKTAVLAMHIPPGFDAFNSSRESDCAKPAALWKTKYTADFLETVEKYQATLRGAYAAHLHRDDFRVFSGGSGPFLPLHVLPPISPIYLNNPAFEVGRYDRHTGALADYSVIYLRNFSQAAAAEAPDWGREYTFTSAYSLPAYSAANLAALAAAMSTKPAVRNEFLDFYTVHNAISSIVATKDWPYYTCAQTQFRPEDYARCACAPASQ